MWFGTRYGLNKYDGNIVKPYFNEPGNDNSLTCSDYVAAVMCDHLGQIWAGTKSGLNRYRAGTDDFIQYLHSNDAGSISDNGITSLLQDNSNNIWVGTVDGLNLLPQPDKGGFVHFLSSRETGNKTDCYIQVLFEDREHNVWIGTRGGIYQLSRQANNWHLQSYGLQHGIEESSIKAITQDSNGALWIGTESGNVYSCESRLNGVSAFRLKYRVKNILTDNIRKIFIDKSGVLWIATIRGLEMFDPVGKIHELQWPTHELENSSIKDIYQDDQGSVWVGTMYQGVFAINPMALSFGSYQHKARNPSSLSGNVISALLATKSGIWVGTEGEGLNLLNPETGNVTRFLHSSGEASSLSNDFIKALMEDKQGNLWIGTYMGGAEKYIEKENRFVHYRRNEKDGSTLSSDYISSFLQRKNGQIWVGSSKGLNLYNQQKDVFEAVDEQKRFGKALLTEYITCLYEDARGRFWIGTTDGVNVYDEKKGRLYSIYVPAKAGNTYSSLYINCFKEDAKGNMWVGTFRHGLYCFPGGDFRFTRFTKEDGLPGNSIRSIELNQNNSLWLSTDHGLAGFNPDTKHFFNYSTEDGLLTGEFSSRSAAVDKSNVFYFGSYNGLVYFRDQRFTNHDVPKLVFTDLRLFNKSVSLKDKSGLLKKNMTETEQLEFAHDQNIFTVSFAALNYIQPKRNKYAFKLEGFDKQWTNTSNSSVTYMNLPSGNYTLWVKGSNNDEVWGEPVSLSIRVLPPWWRTWWAYTLYFLIISGAIYYAFWSFRKQIELENDLYLKSWTNIRNQEQFKAKLDFFTHISHEIRTPLTLIISPLEKILAETEANSFVNRQINNVRRNAERLLNLVNELLDFRKLDVMQPALSMKNVDFEAFCQSVCRAFEPLAIEEGIHLQFSSQLKKGRLVSIDPSYMEKVISNLLSNALKFTPSGGRVEINLFNAADGEQVIFRIWDTGIGIDAESGRHIFDEFYQGKNAAEGRKGWGIGLAMAQKLVEMHSGRIWLEENPSQIDPRAATCFSFMLPDAGSSDAAEVHEVLVDTYITDKVPAVPAVDVQVANGQRPTILVAEDNEEMLSFIRESLSAEFNVLTALNGEEGMQQVLEFVPDLIISDISMPQKNGLEFCHDIKTDVRTSHIPVILLTARATVQSQLEGLTTGADAYITKPFSLKVLELTIRNSLSHARQIHRHFLRHLHLTVETEEAAPRDTGASGVLDTQFINKIREIVEAEMDKPDFGVTSLVQQMGMSRTVLFKKVKALTGMNIQELMKSICLQHAAVLLRSAGAEQARISEIAYKTGFSDPKYFSKEFRKQFGMSPSEYSKNNLSSIGRND